VENPSLIRNTSSIEEKVLYNSSTVLCDFRKPSYFFGLQVFVVVAVLTKDNY
jgi:hypothetical protein